MTTAPYDVDAIRAQFPILSKQVYGKPLVYLDNAASAQKPRAVIDAMVATMEGGYANVHRGLHFMANAATEAFEAARETTREFLNARIHGRDRVHHLGHGSLQPRRRCFGRWA
jgi:cysteine desulfurase/selenocysteine lyase